MALVAQPWQNSRTSGGSSNTAAASGGSTVATTAGSDLFLFVTTRISSISPVVTVTDDASNAWTLVEHRAGGAIDLYLLHAANAAVTTSVTVTFTHPETSASLSVDVSDVVLQEHSNVGALIDSAEGSIPDDGGALSSMTPSGAGDLILAFYGTGSTTRTWEMFGTNVTPNSAAHFTGGQTESGSAYGHTDDTDPVAIGWNRTGGTGTTLSLIQALYAFDDSGPQPLGVTVTGEETAYVGVPVEVSATASGGTSPVSYHWEALTAPTGTFGSTSAASTTYTPTEPGIHTLRCTVTDAADDSAQDDLTVTVTAIPTEPIVGAAGWATAIGAVTRLAALTDDDDATWVETVEDPDGEELHLTLPAMSPPAGDLTVPLRLSSAGGPVTIAVDLIARDAASQPVTIPTAPIEVDGPVTAYAAVWTAAQLAGTTGWDLGHQVRLTATAD